MTALAFFFCSASLSCTIILLSQIKEQENLVKSGRSDSLSLNEFKRETLFHRQAQLAAIEGIARLKSQGVPTLRPDDYFAEMMKSDEHMQKVSDKFIVELF